MQVRHEVGVLLERPLRHHLDHVAADGAHQPRDDRPRARHAHGAHQQGERRVPLLRSTRVVDRFVHHLSDLLYLPFPRSLFSVLHLFSISRPFLSLPLSFVLFSFKHLSRNAATRTCIIERRNRMHTFREFFVLFHFALQNMYEAAKSNIL